MWKTIGILYRISKLLHLEVWLFLNIETNKGDLLTQFA
jgi:hypothetical protein